MHFWWGNALHLRPAISEYLGAAAMPFAFRLHPLPGQRDHRPAREVREPVMLVAHPLAVLEHDGAGDGHSTAHELIRSINLAL
eukprot:6691331-Prymnesium_polylepis.1